MTTKATTSFIEHLFREYERFLWGICYRMTGNAADADDLVQETFVRAIKNPPAKLDEPLRPWLVQVAINLSRDLLRRRKRQTYDGIWLPSPIETDSDNFQQSLPTADDGDPSARYDLLESVSFAFLLALEALTPSQRAVLLLRDVFDYSVLETAAALRMSEPNVKTTLHRARRAMGDYDRSRQIPTTDLQARTRQTMERFLFCLTSNDIAGIENLLASDVRQLSDGGGEFVAARVPIIGRQKVALFNSRVIQLAKLTELRFEWRTINGLPAIITEYPQAPPSYAKRVVTLCELDADGRIQRIHNVSATRKLATIRPVD